MKKATILQAKRFFGKLNPASWLHRKDGAKAPALPKGALTPEERGRAKKEAADADLRSAKAYFEEMRASLALSHAAWNAIFDSNAGHAARLAQDARDGYNAALLLLPPPSQLHSNAEERLRASKNLLAKIGSYSEAKSALDNASAVLHADANRYPYMTGEAQASATAILRMLSDSKPLAEILAGITPDAGFSQDAASEASNLITTSRCMPMFESHVRKMVADYCEEVSARETPGK
ncbi:MAG: hypothetical protein WC861_00835 [Candidatus Micrarchaeia archaeon]|jgi:hypothetical protein